MINQFEIEFEGKIDKNKNEYFVSVCRVPLTVDLSDTVLLLFPWERIEEDGTTKFGTKLVIKKFTPKDPKKNDD
jgi:hypothetical protein